MTDPGRSRPIDLLRRLLGPHGPELTCEECIDQLDRYVELELAGRDADTAIPHMRAHLEGCPACNEDHDSLAAMVGAESEPPGASKRPAQLASGVAARRSRPPQA
jgi:hypothetical protein